MWVEIIGEGKIKFIERYEDPMTGKMHRVSIRMSKNTRQSQKEAQIILNEKIQKALNHTPTVIRTLSDLKDLYIAEQKLSLKQSTWGRNDRILNSVLTLLGSDVYADKLTAGFIRTKFLNSGKDPSTLNNHMVRLKAFIRWCYQNDYIKDTSCIDKLPPFQEKVSAKEKLAHKYLEKDELTLLLNGMHETRWQALTKVMALSGMRIGELIALTVSDVDYKSHVIHITKTYDSTHHVLESGAKTETSNRDLFMQPELEEAVKALEKEQRLFLRLHKVKAHTYLFLSNKHGGYISYYAYNKYLRENSERILHRSISTHALRHTHVALLAENGIPLDEISARLGHADSEITRDVYFHVTKKLEEKRRDRLRAIRML